MFVTLLSHSLSLYKLASVSLCGAVRCFVGIDTVGSYLAMNSGCAGICENCEFQPTSYPTGRELRAL